MACFVFDMNRAVREYKSPDGMVTVGLDDGHLTLRMPGQVAFALFAESPSRFFLKVSEIEIAFSKTAAGKVTQATIYQDGAELKAPRADATPAKR